MVYLHQKLKGLNLIINFKNNFQKHIYFIVTFIITITIIIIINNKLNIFIITSNNLHNLLLKINFLIKY